MEGFVGQFVILILLFVRVMTFVVTAPFLGHQAIPVAVKAAIAGFVSLVLLPLHHDVVTSADMTLLGLGLLALREAIVGSAIGFAAGLIFNGVRFAGEMIGFDMGFSIATTFDPESGTNSSIVSEMLYTMTALVFLLLDGHHFLINALAASYVSVPIGTFAVSGPMINVLVVMTGAIFVAGVKLAAPLIVSLFLVNVALAILTRIVPQMNVFGIAFPVKIGTGMLVLSSSFPIMVFVFKKLLGTFENNVLELLKAM